MFSLAVIKKKDTHPVFQEADATEVGKSGKPEPILANVDHPSTFSP
jgi:hypothetical protein